nr:hypothetical protein RVX_0250 [Nitratidesulfovibrio sp. HK-II]
MPCRERFSRPPDTFSRWFEGGNANPRAAMRTGARWGGMAGRVGQSEKAGPAG